MQRSTTRIRTSHVGRLPAPKGWEDMPARIANTEITEPAVIAAQVTPAVAETVKKQVDIGIDCIGDGEFWTARGLAHYTAHFTGIEARRRIAPHESALSLAVTAARRALHGEGLSIHEIDALLCSTATPPGVTPSLACLILHELCRGDRARGHSRRA